MFDAKFIEQLAEAVALRVPTAPAVPLEHQLWTTTEVAAHVRRNVHDVRKYMACLPSFPKAIRIPGQAVKRPPHPLYNAGEVIAWAKRFKDAN